MYSIETSVQESTLETYDVNVNVVLGHDSPDRSLPFSTCDAGDSTTGTLGESKSEMISRMGNEFEESGYFRVRLLLGQSYCSSPDVLDHSSGALRGACR